MIRIRRLGPGDEALVRKAFYAACGWKREGGSIAMFERAEAL